MANKPSWCPPENEILKKLRRVTDSVNTARRADAPREISRQRGPDDKTAQEWTELYLARTDLQEHLNLRQLRGLSMMFDARERRLA